MNRLHEFTRAALLGLDRAPLPDFDNDPGPDSELRQLLAQVSCAAPAAALLTAAGVLGVYERAGATPVLHIRLPDAAPSLDQTKRPCPASAAYHLGAMLNGRNTPLLDELLTALAAGNYAAPSVLLPALLERGAKQSRQRVAIIKLLDDDQRALAAENPTWRYAGPATDSYSGLRALWRTTSETRELQGLLIQSRGMEPAWGRRLLAGSWKSLADNQRSALIALPADGLGPDDEPFLEAALDDRSQTVRRKAAELLAHLPDSALARRMAARMDDIIRRTHEGEHAVVPRFPEEFSPELIRDGVLPRSGKNVAHLRGMQLMEMVGATPLDHWSEAWRMPPDEVVKTMRDSLWPRTLTQALCTAAVRQQREDWAMALLEATDIHEHALGVVPALSPAACDDLLRRRPQRFPVDEPLTRKSLLVLFLRQQKEMWSPLFIRRFWEQLGYQADGKSVDDEEKKDFLVDSLIKQSARSCPPELLDEGIVLLRNLPASDSRARTLGETISVMEFRRAMLADIEIMSPRTQN
ncbi:MAG: hypothetical protein KDD92_07995 [Caldilineaceae bacterium]|nr:hypothetical protein [Caldilineaceae bacterium]